MTKTREDLPCMQMAQRKYNNIVYSIGIALICLQPLSGTGQTAQQCSILNWNVFLRPGILQDGQLERVDSIAAYLLSSNSDVLVLQETFHRKSRKRLTEQLTATYPYRTNIGKTSFFGISSGVLIYSKHPIVHQRHVFFKTATGFDRLAKKGGVLATIDIQGELIDVIGTHLQAGGDAKGDRIRKRQLARLTKLAKHEQRTTVFVGDFNVDVHDSIYTDLLTTLEVVNKNPEGTIQYTANFSDHSLTHAEGNAKWIDFILLKMNSRGKIVRSWIDEPRFTFEGKRKRVSDHNPVRSILSFSE